MAQKNSNSARGLMQITNETRKFLGGESGGLKEHLITVTKDELNDPNVNICSGVRWLFEKRRLTSSKLKRPATWIETIWEYKGLSKASSAKKKQEIKDQLLKFYQDLQVCKIK